MERPCLLLCSTMTAVFPGILIVSEVLVFAPDLIKGL